MDRCANLPWASASHALSPSLHGASSAFMIFTTCLHLLAATPSCLPRFAGDCRGNAIDVVEVRNHVINNLTVKPLPCPTLLDLDADGDLDLIIGNAYGKMQHFERMADGTFLERSYPFQGIDVGRYATPAFGDWDADEDLDLVVGSSEGNLSYFERLANDTFQQHSTTGSNPFGRIHLAAAAPAFVDWDGDGDLDLVVGSVFDLHYFEHLEDDSVVQRHGARSNPFHGLRHTGRLCKPAFVDWDRDDDLDLVLGTETGQLDYFERIANDTLEKRESPGGNPFHGIDVGAYSAPCFVDWDADDDVDLLLGGYGAGLNFHYFEHLALDTLEQRYGVANDPFKNIDAGAYSKPAFADWDGDRDLDIVIGNFRGELRYIQQTTSNVLEELIGEGSNPFHGIKVDRFAVPAMVDWDADGDLELVVGRHDGNLSYFKRLENITLEDHSGADKNPFHGINIGKRAAPAFVDWDADHDLDLIVGNTFGSLSYFEQVASNMLVERTGAGDNPFYAIDVGFGQRPFPAFVDWDGDQDLDLALGFANGTLLYFEQLANSKLQQRIGKGSNPFHAIDVGSDSAPAFVDWDGDGDIDIVVGGFHGALIYMVRRGCEQPIQCHGRGTCDSIGACTCLVGFSGPSCAICAKGFYTYGSGQPRSCFACPGVLDSDPCSRRGLCLDDAVVDRSGSSATLAMLAVGNGTCKCEEHFFSGMACEKGDCPAGSEEVGSAAGKPNTCSLCAPGHFSSLPDPGSKERTEGGKTACQVCPAGHAAAPGSSFCSECPAGKVALEKSAICYDCQPGSSPSAGQDACLQCDVGTYASPGDVSCRTCPIGKFASKSSAWCSVDGVAWLLSGIVAVLQFAAWLPMLLRIRREIRIIDIHDVEGKAILLTNHPHRIHPSRTPKMLIAGTGADGMHVKVSVLDDIRLELQGMKCVESSMGTLTPLFLTELFHTKLPGVVLSPALLLIVIGLAAAIVAVVSSLTLLANRQDGDRWMVGGAYLFGALSALAGACICRVSSWNANTKLENRLQQFRELLSSQNPYPEAVQRGAQRAVSAGQIACLKHFFSDFIQNRNAYYLNSNITLPLTKKLKLSFAELAGPKEIVFFVSHYWGTAYRHFTDAVQKHAEYAILKLTDLQLTDWTKVSYWVCFLSNNQWELMDELGNSDWRHSSFYKALQHIGCRGTCMVLDQRALPLTRSWCLFEVLQTYKLQNAEMQGDIEAPTLGMHFVGLVFCTSEGVIGEHDVFDTALALASRLTTLSVKDASASNLEDEEMIKTLVCEEEEQTNSNIDDFIRNNMQDTLFKSQELYKKRSETLHAELRRSDAFTMESCFV